MSDILGGKSSGTLEEYWVVWVLGPPKKRIPSVVLKGARGQRLGVTWGHIENDCECHAKERPREVYGK